MPEGRNLNSISKIRGNAAKRQESLINRIKVNTYHLYPLFSIVVYEAYSCSSSIRAAIADTYIGRGAK
jgi:hypothetical protein